MATLADSAADSGSVKAGSLVDRWIYVFMAALFIVVVLVGFIPDSLGKLEAVRVGQRPPFPMILHFHAVLMAGWLLLLLTQATLMATGMRGPHKQLGLAAFVLAPALVIVGFLLVPTMSGQVAEGLRNGPPALQEQLRPVFAFVLNIMLVQMRVGILFALLIGIGLWARRWDTGLHKRLMILGTATAIPAATDRMLWLPSTLPASPLTVDLWPMVVLAPMFFWDLYRLRTVHRAYGIYLGAIVALGVPLHLLWGTQLWRGLAMQILGISGL